MPDKFDPYRESLVVETVTIWPEEFDDLEFEQKQRIEEMLQADPGTAAHLEYIRMHTGFCRQITVTPDDVQRVQG